MSNQTPTDNGVNPDPVNWTRKGNKVTYGDVRDLRPDPILNIRFRKDSTVYGIKVERDTYDIDGMKQQIVDAGRILEPITVSVRADGTKVPLRGNRRTYAGTELANDPAVPAALLKELTEHTPMILLHGLTPEQEAEMVNDQTQKRFLRSEVIRYIFGLRKQRWSFERIALLMWETLGQFSGQAKKVAEIRDLTDPATKREKIRTWLRGTLDMYILQGFDMGPFVQKCMLLSEMQIDGLVPEDKEKPYFKTTVNPQKRMAALKKAKEADGSKWSGVILVEGSEFKKVIDGFRAEDYGTVTTPKVKTPKMLDRAALTQMKESFSSRAVRAMIDRVLGDEVADLTTRDDFSAGQEAREMLVMQYLPMLDPSVAAILRLCYVNPNLTEFQQFLEANTIQGNVPVDPEMRPETK